MKQRDARFRAGDIYGLPWEVQVSGISLTCHLSRWTCYEALGEAPKVVQVVPSARESLEGYRIQRPLLTQ